MPEFTLNQIRHQTLQPADVFTLQDPDVNHYDPNSLDGVHARILVGRLLSEEVLQEGVISSYNGPEDSPLMLAATIVEAHEWPGRLGKSIEGAYSQHTYGITPKETRASAETSEDDSFYALTADVTLADNQQVTAALRVLRSPAESNGTLAAYKKAFPGQEIHDILRPNDLEQKGSVGPWDMMPPLTLPNQEASAAVAFSYLVALQEAQSQGVNRIFSTLNSDERGALHEMGISFDTVAVTDSPEDERQYFGVINVSKTDFNALETAVKEWRSDLEAKQTKKRHQLVGGLATMAANSADAQEELASPEVDPRYYLTQEQMRQLELDMVKRFKEEHPDQHGVVVFSVPTNSPYADIVRTMETRAFEDYDSSEAMKPYEDHSEFFYTVNLDGVNPEKKNHLYTIDLATVDEDQKSYIGFAKRLVTAREIPELPSTKLRTGIEVIDDRFVADDPNESTSLTEIAIKHGIRDFAKCLNVTTSVVVLDATRENPYTLLSYKAVFKRAEEAGMTHVLGYLNELTIGSLATIGVKYENLAGREFHLPKPKKPGKPIEYDKDFTAVCGPVDGNQAAFNEPDPKYRLRNLVVGRDVPVFEIAA